MNFINNLKIGTKLAVGFGVCLFVLLAVAIGSAVSMSKMHDVVKAMDADAIMGLSSIDDVMDADNTIHTLQSNYLITDASGYADLDKRIGELRSSAETQMSTYDKTIAHEDDRKNFDKYKEIWKAFLAAHDQYRGLLNKANKSAAIAFYRGELDKTFTPLQAQVSLITEYNKKIANDYITESDASFASAIKILVLLVSVGIVSCIGFGMFLTRRITGPVSRLSDRMSALEANCITDFEKGIEALSRGDLTYRFAPTTKPLEVASHDETGKMTETFNSLLEKIQRTVTSYDVARKSLTDLVGQLKNASSQVSGASLSLTSASQQVESAALEVGASMKEIASASTQAARGAAEVASGSTSQAQALSQSSHNIQRLVESIQSVAKDAESASVAASTAGNAAAEGTGVVEDSMRGMKAIENTVSQSASVIQTLGESSQKIGTIVQTINEIAEQTNLLALNAAIEAARAGDAGRGFAVVADEVRKLAERSGGATREIGALISEIQNHTSRAVAAMEAGTREVKSQNQIAESTQAAFTKIQDVFKSVVDRVEDIRRATHEMAGASQDVARSITEVAAVVEESSAAAEELSASAEQVSASVDTVAGAAQQQSAAVTDLVTSSDQLQTLSLELGDIVASFRIEAASNESATHLHLRRAA